MDEPRPLLSVVIPTYNRAEPLLACLRSLAAQTQPTSDFEVLVVVDGASDGTRAALANLEVPYRLTVLWQENQGQHIARNRGADAARGRYLVFIDDDVRVDAAFIAEHLRVQRSEGGLVGIGRLTISIESRADWFTSRFAEAFRDHYAELGKGSRNPTWCDCCGGNLSVERAVFHELGGFAEDVRRSHDIELGFRLHTNGSRFVYIDGAVGHIEERKRIGDLARDYRSAGKAYIGLASRHPSIQAVLLGHLAEASLRERLLRAILHFLHVPPTLLDRIFALIQCRTGSPKPYRFLQNYFYWSGVRAAIRDRSEWKRLMHGTPILMYHAFGDERAGSRYVMPIHRFAQQMKWLRRLGYHVMGLEEFLRCRLEHQLPPARSVVLTIDDAYADIRQLAHPVLKKHGYPATVFVVSGLVGGSNNWTSAGGIRNRQLLGWNQIAEMSRDGIDFGGHSNTHPVLPSLSAEQAREEIMQSKQSLEEKLGKTVRGFAYPFGERNAAIEKCVEEAGYWGACGVDPGLNTLGTPLYALHRTEMEGDLPLFRFMLALWTGHTHLALR
jgi:glycosyltransferase involved in cell wall biosynthesis